MAHDATNEAAPTAVPPPDRRDMLVRANRFWQWGAMASANPLIEVDRLLSAGRVAEAASMLIGAADAGDADALFTLASWRISGQIIRRDTAAARELMNKAGEAGHSVAALLHAHFVANGTGGPADWKLGRDLLAALAGVHPRADEQLAMLGQMAVRDDGEPTDAAELETISESPMIQSRAAFFTGQECAYLAHHAEPLLKPSVITDRATGRSYPDPVRRSDGAYFGVANEDLVVSALNRRIAAATGTAITQAEPLQLLRYGPGGEFRPHLDSVKPGGNQRIVTAIVYLSAGYDGGETRFMRTGLEFKGGVGDLLTFRNVTPAGQPDLLAEHAGMPVRSGTKLVASRWIWSDPPVAPPPVPLLGDI